MKTELLNILARKNAHKRDANIQFVEQGHKYFILNEPNVHYTSVTTWNHSKFEKFDADKIITNMMNAKSWKQGHKYWGLSAEQIKNMWDTNRDAVSKAGSDLHYEIECFNNDKRFTFEYTNKELYEMYMCYNKENVDKAAKEWQYFIQFIKDYPHLKPYRTEWMIYDEDAKIAGSIDMVYENPDGTLSIYDWKRSKEISKTNNFSKFSTSSIICHIPDCNFWHYALQLNTYKYILEKKYGKQIKDLHLVRLHPDETNYELIKLPILSTEMDDLFEERTKEVYAETA